jgi:YidC/Oxa1 family membrane protein insertase
MQQLRSMREMQRIQPKVEELRCKYRDDAMRLQKETMQLYKEHKINPLGGCLPMLLQVPVFISFYLVLARSIELKGANFLWIKDLSEPDKLMSFPNVNVPFLSSPSGNLDLNLLPILMTVASFFQQKASAGQMSGQSAEQQKIMMWLFPVIFFFFFYHMPSGLVLYWFTNTVLTVTQQTFIMKNK